MRKLAVDVLKRTNLYGVLSYWLYQPRLLKIMAIRGNRRIIKEYLRTNHVRKLQIGSGQNLRQGWLNSDINFSSRDVLYLDATKTFPFDDGVFDYVHSEHMIEHITYEQGCRMLSECHRILKPGGRIRIATPDLSFLIDLYAPYKSELQNDYIRWALDNFVPDVPAPLDTFVINNFVRDWEHKFIYDQKVLRLSLENVGFLNIVKRNLNESGHEDLRELENESRMPDGFLALETIVLEAEKPVEERHQ